MADLQRVAALLESQNELLARLAAAYTATNNENAESDYTRNASVPALLKGILAVLHGRANPVFETIDLTVANNIYTVRVCERLANRNAYRGVIKAAAANGGTVQFQVSADGVNYSGWFSELAAGESFSLDGMNVHTLRFKSSTGGDDVLLAAW